MDASAALFVALSGAAVTGLGVLFTRLSNRDTARQTEATHALDTLREQHALFRDLVDDLRLETERLRTARTQDREACERAIEELRAELDRVRREQEGLP